MSAERDEIGPPDDAMPMIIDLRVMLWEGITLPDLGAFIHAISHTMTDGQLVMDENSLDRDEPDPTVGLASGKTLGMALAERGGDTILPFFIQTHTPTPNEFFRTVNVSRAPAPCRLITMPSNTWIRDRVPSITRKCTRTVSPALKSGTSRRWRSSMS